MIGNNEILNYLLVKEDFLPEPTDLGDGKITIGSGLTDSKWLDLYRKRGNKWSKEDNKKAVLEEIQKRRLWAEQNVPHWNNLPEPSQDALLSYRYNYNFTPKNSPKLFKALEDKNYLEAARQIDATSKNPDFKKGLLNRRKEEQQWFLSGFPELSKSNDFAIPYKYPAPEYPTAAEAYKKSMAPITGNYSQGGQLKNHKQWKDLSYSEKNDIIKVAVRNGITTLPEIRQKYNEFANEGNLYAGGGYVYDMLPQLFASDGVQVRVTSGYRPNSRVQGSGKPSRHSMHEAADIVGDFSAIRRVLDNPESNTAKWMRANGYGYLDETSKTGTKKFWHDQKGDHSHYHIGKDSGIAKKFATSTGITSNAIPIVSSGNYLDIAKAHIRNNEGWSPMPVADGPKNTGWRSVGYGFNDSGFRAKYPQGISKAYENGITKAQAEQELDYILGNMDSHLRKVYGSKWNSFNDNQKAAILDTYYQRPASVVGRNSAFYNAVMRGDNNAVNYLGVAGYNTRNNDRRKLFSSTVTQMPETAQTVQQPLFYQPWNPQAANLYTSSRPLTSYPAPIFSREEQEEYFAKQIVQAQKQQEAEQREKQRQEKTDRINRFSLLMSLTDPYSSDSSSSNSVPFADTVNMLTQRSPIPYFSNGGSIFIKPENRGKFTRLKERTGHSASWFKENGTPAQKKMATFALNSKHWKHGLGGNLFKDGGDTKANIPVTYFTQNEAMPLLADNPNRTAVLDEVTVRPYKKLPMQSELFQGITNQAANEKADEYANRTSLTPGRFLGLMGANIPLAAGALGATVAAPALFDSTIAPISDYITGSSIAGVPTTTWLNTGMEAGFAGHGLNHAVNEGINGLDDAAMTALEVAPLGKLAKPMWNAGRNNLGLLKDDAKAFYNNLTMDLNSVSGRFYHGSPSRTIEEFIPGDSGGIYFTPTKRAARGYTGSLGTGKVYEANLNLGDSPVVVDARGKAWNAIPEEAVEKAFGMPKEEIYEQIGHYNAGAEPWYSDFLKPFGYSPNTRSYAIDQIVTLGKDLGKSSLTIKGARDSGKGLFGWRQLPYDQTVVYSPEQISLLEKSYPIKSTTTITAENAASITPKQWTAAQDTENTLSGLLPNAKPLVAEENPWITTANANDVLAHPSTGRRFQLYKDVYEKEIPKEVKQIYRNAVLPRLQKAHSDYLPLQELTRESVEKALSKDYTVYPERVFKDAGKNNTAGLAFPDGHIAIKEGYEDYAVGHEVRHRLQYFSAPQSMKELKLLDDAYDANFVNLGREYPEFEGLNLDIEKETLNYDARRSLVGDDVLKKFDLDTQNTIIDDMSDIDIFDAVEEADGYGRAYIDFLRKNNLLTHKKAQQFREAMKHVGAYAAPVGVAIGTSAATLYNKSK